MSNELPSIPMLYPGQARVSVPALLSELDGYMRMQNPPNVVGMQATIVRTLFEYIQKQDARIEELEKQVENLTFGQQNMELNHMDLDGRMGNLENRLEDRLDSESGESAKEGSAWRENKLPSRR